MKIFQVNNYGPIVTCFGYEELSIDTFQELWVNSIRSHSVHALIVLVQFFQFEGSRLRNDEYFHFQDLFYKFIFFLYSKSVSAIKQIDTCLQVCEKTKQIKMREV